MFIKGNWAIYIDKNLKIYENSTGIFVLWFWSSKLENELMTDRVSYREALVYLYLPLLLYLCLSLFPSLSLSFSVSTLSLKTAQSARGEPDIAITLLTIFL